MKSNSEARPSTVFLFYYTSIFTINFTAAEKWVSITRLSMKQWDDRSELRINERLSLRFFLFGLGMKLKESGITFTIEIRYLKSNDKFRNPVPGIGNRQRGIQNPRL